MHEVQNLEFLSESRCLSEMRSPFSETGENKILHLLICYKEQVIIQPQI